MTRGWNESRRRNPLALWAGLALALAGVVASAPTRAVASEASDRGKAWLLANVQADGSWRSVRDPSGIRSTARALLCLGADAPAATPLWLTAQKTKTLEEASEAARALRTSSGEGALAPVQALRRSPGTWSSAVGFDADPFHTSLAVLASAYGGTADLSELAKAADSIGSAQKPDGSWAAGAEGQETAVTTAAVLEALLAARISPSAPRIVAGRQWLLAHQNLDGGWGTTGSTPASTAQALALIRWLGCPLDAETRAVGYLAAAQAVDGSWEADTWTTALCTSVLTSAGLPELTVPLGGITVSADPVPGDPWELRATVTNWGTVPALSVLVRFVTNTRVQRLIGSAIPAESFPGSVGIRKALPYTLSLQNRRCPCERST